MDFNNDSRFAAVAKDPRFRQVPKQERKVKIDKRFQGMFTDKRFKLKYSVDKRGRPENQSSGENLKKFYELDSDEDEEDDGEAVQHVPMEGSDDDQRTRKNTAEASQKVMKKTRRRSGRELLLAFKRRKARLSEPEIDRSTRKTITQKRKLKVNTSNSGSEDDLTFDQYSDSEDEESGLGSDESPRKRSKRKGHDPDSDSESAKSRSQPSWQKQMGIDLARGEGNIETSSSDSDSDDEAPSTSEPVSMMGEICHSWGELDADAPREEATSRRLAVCNLDWDSVTASDLFVLLNSFKPTGGVLHSVKIYPSEFGLERMREEDAKGPQELVEKDETSKKLSGKQQERYHREKLRKYQMQRLKYYYAVVDCDDANTANNIYEQCDGMEYETSASKLDLRFIPDDTTFDHEPKDEACEAPDAAQFKPIEFQTSALTQSSVHLTWDENDKRRAKDSDELFKSKKKMEEMESHMQAYLASSSSDDEDEEGVIDDRIAGFDEEDGENDNPKSEIDRINIYRNLLKGIEEKEKKEGDKDMEMEISWEPGLKESTQAIVQKKAESSSSTPWEKYLEKKKEKKKERKQERKKLKTTEDIEVKEGEDFQAFSDDDIPDDVDFNDSFFKDSLKDQGKSGGKSKKKGAKEEDMKTEEELEEEKQRKAALELLMLDEEDDGREHFNLKSIIEKENMTKSKRKRQLKQQRKLGQPADDPTAATTQDNFEINTADPRFDALFTSHAYAIDPSDPHYKKTKAMETLITEKQKRRQRKEKTGAKDDDGGKAAEKKGEKKMDVEVSQLVRSIKNKTEQFHSRKKLKPDS